MKKIWLSFVLLICLVFFAGCSPATVNYVNTNIESIYITVSYDAENVAEIGADTEPELASIKQEIESDAVLYMNQLTKKYKNIVNALYENGALTANERILYKNHLNLYTGWDDETYIIELRFYTPTASRIFVKYGGVTEGSKIAESLFVTKVSEEYTELFTLTPDSVVSGSVTDYFTDGVSDLIEINYGETGLAEFDGLKIGYMFLTSNSRLHSNGFEVETTEGTVHYFADVETPFIFYRVEANRYVWYLFALTVAMIFVATMLVVAYFRKNDKVEKLK